MAKAYYFIIIKHQLLMLGWILYHKPQNAINSSDYTINRLLEAAAKKGIELKIYSPSQFEIIVTRDDARSILIDEEVTALPDFLIPRMGSDTSYFALAIIRHLERLNTYICNRSTSIEMVKDKMHMHQILGRVQLPTPKTMLLKFPSNVSIIDREIGFPLIIKNISGTEGSGIYLCKSKDEFSDLMELIYSNNEKANIIVQEFLQTSHGKDIRIFVLGGKVIGAMERSSKESFKANYSRGGQVNSIEVTQEMKDLAIEAASSANLEIAGIDLLFDNDGFKVCEANSAPDFKGLEKVMGANIAEHIIDYVTAQVNRKAHH